MTVLPLFHSCVEQSGELCCCTTCCDFYFSFFFLFCSVKAGALLCFISHFVFSLSFFLNAYYVLSLILSFICICSIYKYIIYFIFFYIYVFLLSWVWCNYVILL